MIILGNERYTIEDGPHGGLGGRPFTDGDGVNRNGYITALQIRAKREIDAIRARYGDTWGDWHGGTGGDFYQFTLNEGAYIYLVQGTVSLNTRCPNRFGTGSEMFASEVSIVYK